MKSFSTNYSNHIQQNVTTLCTIIKILRKDNTAYRFTDYDSIIIFGGEEYKPSNAFKPTDFQTSATLSVDNLDITGIINEIDDITEEDIFKEFFYNATIWVSQINYTNPDSGQNKILYGSLGEISLQENKYIVEFRNLTYKLTKKITDVFSKTCRVEFGSEKCGVDINPSAWQADTEYCIGDAISNTPFDNRRYIVTTPGLSGSTKPSFDTTITNETTDNEITWTTYDSLIKYSQVYASNKFRLYIKEARDSSFPSGGIVAFQEFKFFDSLDSRIYPISCTTNAIINPGNICDNLSDDNTGTIFSSNGPMEDKYVTFTFSSNIDLKSLSMVLNPTSTYIVEFYVQISYDNESTWHNIYEFKNGTKNYWSLNSGTLNILNSDISVLSQVKVPTNGSIFTDMDYVVDGVLTWTSGNNNGLSMEIVGYNTTSKELTLFKPMPYNYNFGDTFTIKAGCNHLFIGSDGTTATGNCVSRYNNGNNFRGEPYVPTEDVLVGGIGETNKAAYVA